MSREKGGLSTDAILIYQRYSDLTQITSKTFLETTLQWAIFICRRMLHLN